MAKFSGFCMSALLIVICLWIDVRRYPNAFDGPENAGKSASCLKTVAESSAQTEARASSAAPKKSSESSAPQNGAAAQESASETDSAPTPEPRDTILADAAPDANPRFDADFANVSGAKSRSLAPAVSESSASPKRAVSVELAPQPSRDVPARLEPETGVKSRPTARPGEQTSGASKPQGGKYVSIPPVETDAISSAAFDDDCRVFGATRAEKCLVELAD